MHCGQGTLDWEIMTSIYIDLVLSILTLSLCHFHYHKLINVISFYNRNPKVSLFTNFDLLFSFLASINYYNVFFDWRYCNQPRFNWRTSILEWYQNCTFIYMFLKQFKIPHFYSPFSMLHKHCALLPFQDDRNKSCCGDSFNQNLNNKEIFNTFGDRVNE
jgi:hypothetical protein